jgi:hypothetical protein
VQPPLALVLQLCHYRLAHSASVVGTSGAARAAALPLPDMSGCWIKQPNRHWREARELKSLRDF